MLSGSGPFAPGGSFSGGCAAPGAPRAPGAGAPGAPGAGAPGAGAPPGAPGAPAPMRCAGFGAGRRGVVGGVGFFSIGGACCADATADTSSAPSAIKDVFALIT